MGIPEAYIVGGKRQRFKMDEDTKRTGIITLGIGAVLVTMMLLLSKDCADTNSKKLECVKVNGNTPIDCDCLFSNHVCPDKK